MFLYKDFYSRFVTMKWVTVQEYKILTGLSIPAIYKQVRLLQVTSEKKYGKIVISYTKKKKTKKEK